MKTFLTRAEVRQIDERALREFGILGMVLMENAARGVADKICQFGVSGPVVICCGKGNNGGDGLAVARHLDLRRINVEVLLFCEPSELQGDALTNFQICQRSQIPLTVCADTSSPAPTWRHLVGDKFRAAGWIIDALLGTGASGEPREPIAHAIDYLNRAERPVVAIDLPSGLDCDTGIPAAKTVRALHTCTFVAAKTGFQNPLAVEFLGAVHVLDIGAPRILIDEYFR